MTDNPLGGEPTAASRIMEIAKGLSAVSLRLDRWSQISSMASARADDCAIEALLDELAAVLAQSSNEIDRLDQALELLDCPDES